MMTHQAGPAASRGLGQPDEVSVAGETTAVQVAHLRKTYGPVTAVADVSLAPCIAALFAIGLAIAALAPTAGAARGLMAVAMYPMLFFGGLYFPTALLPAVIQHTAGYTPLGAAVTAISAAWVGQFPAAQSLLVQAGYALVFGFLARRYFRWE